MVTNDSTAVAGNRRRPARDLIAAVVENMRRNLETLKYSTLAPSRYVVYLHPAEFSRLEGIIPILKEETIRALREELQQLNNPTGMRRFGGRLFGGPTQPKVQTAAGEWQVEFLADPDGDLAEGDILIDSELLLPAEPELGVGERTRRITTSHTAQQTTTHERTVRTKEAVAPRPFARLTWEDQGGSHTYDIAADVVTIGRGGNTCPVDVKVVSSVDVSREHARIRRDPATGQFFLIDLSSFGTTLNQRHVPRGYDDIDGVRRETGTETPVPDGARIGLAETVFLDFAITEGAATAGH